MKFIQGIFKIIKHHLPIIGAISEIVFLPRDTNTSKKIKVVLELLAVSDDLRIAITVKVGLRPNPCDDHIGVTK